MAAKPEKPLVYSCSGCSSAAQMCNHLALELDREGHAQMSCIAGVGGNVSKLVRTAASGRPIIALDGCHLTCVSACLAQRGLNADLHWILTDLGVKKRYHQDFDGQEAREVYEKLVNEITEMN